MYLLEVLFTVLYHSESILAPVNRGEESDGEFVE